MTDFLVKHFVKDYEKINDEKVRTAYGVLSSVVGMICNIFLFAVKVLIGMVLGSVSVVADAFNNLSDACSSIISFVGVKLAEKPADREHPFGHGRYEYIAAFVVSFLVIEVGISFVKTSVDKIFNPEEMHFSVISIVILCLSILVKLWMSIFNKTLGERIHSSVMKATATDALGDALTTAATIVSLLVYRIFAVNVDGIVGLLVAIVVILAGIGIARDTIRPLLGERPDPEVYQMLEEKVKSYEGIMGVHDLIIHNYGPTKSMATIHAEVKDTMDMESAHDLIDHIEREVTKETGIFLVIHMDPVNVKDPHVQEWKQKITAQIQEMDKEVTMHDLHLTADEEQLTLSFDLVMPYSYSSEQTNQFVGELEKRLKAIDSRCQCMITIDHSYGDEK